MGIVDWLGNVFVGICPPGASSRIRAGGNPHYNRYRDRVSAPVFAHRSLDMHPALQHFFVSGPG